MLFIYTVPEQHCVIVKRFNEFARVEHSGLHVRLPMAESFHRVPDWGNRANKQGMFIELSEQQSNTRPRQCQTKDNVTVDADASVYWRISDPVKACFEVDVLPDVMEDVTLNALRSQIGKMELDEVLSNRDTINKRIAEELETSAEGWGVEVKRVEIQELSVDQQTRRAMTQQMEAERQRRAQIASSEGEAEAKVKVAEAERQSSVAIAEGQAEALRKLAKADAEYLQAMKEQVGPDQAAQLLLAQKYIRGFSTISENEAHKVFLPNSVEALLSLGGGSDGQTGGKSPQPTARGSR